MSKAVLELNDHAMGLYNHNGLIVSSPAYVLAHGKQPQFGQQALEQSRLHPVSSNNEFWYRLGMTPLSRPLAHFRHYADVAHGHLMHLAQESGFDGEVVVAVPASFSREQLAVLSGVLQHSPFKTLAMMDSALLVAASHLPASESLVYVDLQLHQLSMTRLSCDAGNVRHDAFAVVPGAGWTGLSNTLVQLVTDAFIAQSRFNPQHSAVWEQQLYNELPAWLQQFYSGQQEILVRIQADKNTVQARISLSDVLEVLQPAFRKIQQHIAQLVTDASVPVVLSERAALIPGLASLLNALPLTVSGEHLAEIGLRALSASSVPGNGVSYISSVARAASVTKSSATEFSAAIKNSTGNTADLSPTHILHQAQAWPLPLVASMDAGKKLVLKQTSAGQPPATDELFRIESDGKKARLLPASTDLLLAGEVVSGATELYAGDIISVNSIAAELQCIRVYL